jgi:hypothetical protein
MPNSPGRGPFLGMVMGGPSGRLEHQQTLVMTPRVRREVDEPTLRLQTMLPSSSTARAEEGDVEE